MVQTRSGVKLTAEAIKQGSKQISPEELLLIQKVVISFPNLSRSALSDTLCEHLQWFSPSGMPRRSSALRLLEDLAARGLVILPQKRHGGSRPDSPPMLTERTKKQNLLTGSLKQFGSIELVSLEDKADIQLWNEYVQRYHPLGHKRPFGHWLRYFVCADGKYLGCLLISGAARALHHRDQWIGWSLAERRRNLPWVINNSRYVIFSWVRIPHLASHVLGKLAHRVASDWAQRWGYRPVLMETFVDPRYYAGTCYRAAGWQELGMTQGTGHFRPDTDYTTSPKCILAKPLSINFRQLLCSEQLRGRIIE